MRPVNWDGVTVLAAKKLIARNPEILGLNIQESILDGSECFCRQTVWCGPDRRSENPIDPLVIGDRTADDTLSKPADHIG